MVHQHKEAIAAAATGESEDDAAVGLGIVSMVDASECPPTYGSDFNDVQGYVPEGWRAIKSGC